MAFKIYKKNNYIIIKDTVSNKQYQGLAKNVFVYKNNLTESTYDFDGITYNGLKGVSLSDIIDENDNSFASEQLFIDFYTLNTGNFNTPGATGNIPNLQQVTDVGRTTTEEIVSTDGSDRSASIHYFEGLKLRNSIAATGQLKSDLLTKDIIYQLPDVEVNAAENPAVTLATKQHIADATSIINTPTTQVYEAVFSQLGTAAPTESVVFKNEIGFMQIIFERTSAGQYRILNFNHDDLVIEAIPFATDTKPNNETYPKVLYKTGNVLYISWSTGLDCNRAKAFFLRITKKITY